MGRRCGAGGIHVRTEGHEAKGIPASVTACVRMRVVVGAVDRTVERHAGVVELFPALGLVVEGQLPTRAAVLAAVLAAAPEQLRVALVACEGVEARLGRGEQGGEPGERSVRRRGGAGRGAGRGRGGGGAGRRGGRGQGGGRGTGRRRRRRSRRGLTSQSGQCARFADRTALLLQLGAGEVGLRLKDGAASAHSSSQGLVGSGSIGKRRDCDCSDRRAGSGRRLFQGALCRAERGGTSGRHGRCSGRSSRLRGGLRKDERGGGDRSCTRGSGSSRRGDSVC